MYGIIVFAVFMVIWKALDIGIQAYQLHLQAILQAYELKVEKDTAGGGESPGNEEKHIGFNYCSNLTHVEDY